MLREQARILNVNDNPAALYLTTLTLRRAGYEVLEASSGEQALELARQSLDLILLDVRLPDLSGHEVCAQLKANPSTSSIVVLQTSAADVDGSARAAGLQAGADGYLAQPYEEQELLAWVNALLRARRTIAASHERLSRLQQVTAALCDAVTPEDVTTVIFQRGLEALQAKAGGVALLSADGQTVELVSMHGYPESTTAAFRRQPASAHTPIVAHDLRNPLSALTTATGLMRRSLPCSESEQLQNRLATIERSARRMNHLIQDLLDLARFQAGTLVLNRERHTAGELLQEVHDSHSMLAADKSLRLSVEPVDPRTVVRCDRDRVLQAFSNLVGNAIKFTPEGGQIVLGASGQPGAVVFSVRDTGPGISPEHLPQLFDRFFQVDPANRNGVGLGLSIVKAIVDAHGGRLSVESQPGQGALFTFELPHDPPHAA